jgi:hypothetical protein
MTGRRDRLLFFAHGGMELSWLYAWATFLMISVVHQPFPLPEAIGTFVLATVLTRSVRGRGLRVIMVLAVQMIGFVVAASKIVHVVSYQSYPFFGQQWLTAFFSRTRDPLEWLILVIILFFALLFWLAGVTLARRSSEYLTVCTRFDLGVAAFFCLLLIKFLLLVKGGIEIQDNTPELLLFPFFTFSLLAIGMARNQSSAQRDFLSGYRGIGVFVSFTLVVLALGAGLVLLLLPYLSAAAEVGYGALKSAAGPLSPILVSILRFLFLHGRSRPDTAAVSSGRDGAETIPSAESSWWNELVEKILGWGLLGLIGLIALVVSCIGIWYLVRWLLSRTPTEKGEPVQWNLILSWAARLWALGGILWGKIATKLKGFKDATQLYKALLAWGRHSGFSRVMSETPREYGFRLRNRFPRLEKDIELIVEAFNREVYGEVVLDEGQLRVAKRAWRRLCSPRQWPNRLKSWFLQPSELIRPREDTSA